MLRRVEIDLNDTVMSKRQDYLDWDSTFMFNAVLVAQRSKDPNTQVGACIVDTKKRIVGLGYNGFPRGCDDDAFPWSKEKEASFYDTKYMYVVHAETNAIMNSNQSELSGCTLYVTHHPCHECAKLIIQSGINKVYYSYMPECETGSHKSDSIKAALRMFAAARVACVQYRPSQSSLTLQLPE